MERKIPITVYLDNTDLMELGSIHNEYGTPLSTIVRTAVKEYLVKRKKES